MLLLMSISKHVLSSTAKYVVFKLPIEVFKNQSVSKDPTESVYLALWIFQSHMVHVCKARDVDFVLTPENMSRHKLDIYMMCNDSSLWKDTFHAQPSGIVSRKIVCCSSASNRTAETVTCSAFVVRKIVCLDSVHLY